MSDEKADFNTLAFSEKCRACAVEGGEVWREINYRKQPHTPHGGAPEVSTPQAGRAA